MEKLIDKIMNVLTRFDESSSSYITPTQEPFVRKELEEVVKQAEQADGIVRRLADYNIDRYPENLIEQARIYVIPPCTVR